MNGDYSICSMYEVVELDNPGVVDVWYMALEGNYQVMVILPSI